jgi:hypothetical protein
MRFDPKNPGLTQLVDWYFTDDNAPWVGLENAFNSRNWYGGVNGWPEIGEVQGSPRPWRDGSSCPQVLESKPTGSAEEWKNGTTSFLAGPPCTCPCQYIPTLGAGFVDIPPLLPTFNLGGGDIAAALDLVTFAFFWVAIGTGVECCHTGQEGFRFYISTTPDLTGVICELTMLDVDVTHDQGDWLMPASSPYYPGEVITVFSD